MRNLLFIPVLTLATLVNAQTNPTPKNQPVLTIQTKEALLSMDYSPDGKRIVTGGQTNDVDVWDAATGKLVFSMKGHNDDVVAVKYSPNGRFIASGGVDKNYILWDAITGDLVRRQAGHTDYVRDVAFSPDSKTLATASWDGTAMVWEVLSGRAVATLSSHRDNVTSVAFSTDGAELLTASGDHKLKVWDTKTWQEKATVVGHTDEVWDANFAPNGLYAVSGGWDNMVRVWDLSTKKELYVLPAHTSDVWTVTFSPNGQLVASGGGDRKIKVWEMATGRLVADVSGSAFGAEVETVVFSPSGNQVAGVSRDGFLKIWNTPTVQQRIDKYTTEEMAVWVQKKEFEKTEEFNARIAKSADQKQKFDLEIMRKIMDFFTATTPWQKMQIGTYDADNEVFPLISPIFGDLKVKVPIKDAQDFKANFDNGLLTEPDFEVKEDRIMLRSVELFAKRNRKPYLIVQKDFVY